MPGSVKTLPSVVFGTYLIVPERSENVKELAAVMPKELGSPFQDTEIVQIYEKDGSYVKHVHFNKAAMEKWKDENKGIVSSYAFKFDLDVETLQTRAPGKTAKYIFTFIERNGKPVLHQETTRSELTEIVKVDLIFDELGMASEYEFGEMTARRYFRRVHPETDKEVASLLQ
ncbi:hypothetical protein BV898_14631 [Hypsibius exemplaris]|uniref:Uncharacterized protein n=1 Tax=Hypsibius exemplaris TaxID=2072580 RepID=A0A9X6RJQ8_HYPEX|nr:hypothetical protein BV898_14631 [Hypsibius exemplaris]